VICTRYCAECHDSTAVFRIIATGLQILNFPADDE
jgi:hypothetical protein